MRKRNKETVSQASMQIMGSIYRYIVRDCGSVAMGVTGGSMWNAPPSKIRNYQMFTFVKNVQVNSN